MKTITNIISILGAALLLSVMLPVAASAGSEKFFHGTYEAQESTVEQFPLVFVEGDAWGNANHLGPFSATYQAEVDLSKPLESFGSAHFVSANGDRLFTDTLTLSLTFLEDDTFLIEDLYTITGGTGRFAGASGTFTMEYILNVATHQRSGQFAGTIVFAKGN